MPTTRGWSCSASAARAAPGGTASAGSLFHVPVVVGGDAVQVLERIGGWGRRRLGAVAAGGTDYGQCDLISPLAFVLGNEAAGLPEPLTPLLDARVTIPMAG